MVMMMMMNDVDGGGALVWLVLLHCGACVDVLCAPACVGHLLDVRLCDGDLLLLPSMCFSLLFVYLASHQTVLHYVVLALTNADQNRFKI